MNISAAGMVALLRARYAPPSYAFLPQVPNGTGSHRSRTADALAMSLWPSRGLEMHGFEVKVSRADWLRELKEPAKADAIAKFCDRWWIVAPSKEVVRPVELPKGWGLLVLRGSALATAVEGSIIESQPVSRAFLAAVLRVAARPGEGEIAAASDAAYKVGFEKGKESAKSSRGFESREEDTARRAIAEFEAASGVKINEWRAGHIGEAVKFVMEGKVGQRREQLVGLQQQTKRIYDEITRVLKRGAGEDVENVKKEQEQVETA